MVYNGVSRVWKWRFISLIFTVSAVQSSTVTIGNPATPASSGLSKGRRVFLLAEGSPLPSLILNLDVYFRNLNPLFLQTWRREVKGEFKFRLIEEYKIYPERIGENKISASDLPCMLLNTDDRIGLYIEDQPSSVVFVYDFDHPAALSFTYEDDVSSSAALGDTLDFDTLPLALSFSVNAELYIGEKTSLGHYTVPTCADLANFTKSTTTLNPIGPTNPTQKGEKGDKGDRGAPGIPAAGTLIESDSLGPSVIP
ncbi:hypothetical protein CAPTEDRAFT_191626 [Capitella teleta]|uniref:Uncharacterized protein n=1 Tax=Capitella teleta TaxID=283909 RepID=R7V277_CAPTE|nr:hypothetical protein CAPTEDRAFT_191626 [Capitella teleta]|eukprot:ELU09796.1 hypothetical protein CAPTEDRAFT_191626 [Capitella teleta]